VAHFQSIVVFVLVSVSVLLSLWWLTPLRRRLWLLDHLVSAHAKGGPLVKLRRSLLAKSVLGACGACKANPSADAQRSTQKTGALRR
jgi:hypothetical protein